MFCYQCEQTYRTPDAAGCNSTKGMCGKDETTSDLQDILIYNLKGLAQLAQRARQAAQPNREADRFILYGMFTTLTNVNFTAARFTQMLQDCAQLRANLANAGAGTLPSDLTDSPTAAQSAIQADLDQVGEDVVGLRALVLYGMKGVCAYAHHARVLGYESEDVYAGVEDIMAFLATSPSDVATLVGKTLEVGHLNLKVMELLNDANTGKFGTPEPTQVRTTAIKGKAILVSGHDMGDLEALLEQTKGKGINIYTHGEMLPSHSYPKLKAYPHLAGNYGGAWQDQQTDFANFPGPVLMTSNCIIEPQPGYRQRIFTTGPVGWPGVRHLEDHKFAAVIDAALGTPGFKEDAPAKTITIGFGKDTVLGVADKVIAAVKGGDIRHFFLIGGCDGAVPGRNYYTDFATQAPQDTVIMTLGCNKYRFNSHDFGDIGGIPRLLDIGQCNDTHSAIVIASALAKAFDCTVNDLPLSLIVSWFEQKAAAVLLSLLALGIRNIRLGPTLPAFITPKVLDVLVENFAIKPITTAEADMAAALKVAV